MTRCLVTFAVGPYEELLEIALPGFERFAEKHSYELVVATPEPCERAPSWWKVPLLVDALDAYEEALWVDADMVVVDDSDDLDVPEIAWEALVRHRTADGQVPNCGLWLVRRPMLPWLERIWAQTSRLEHGWWEQAALMDFLGYTVDERPARLAEQSTLYEHTEWLDPGWNVHRNDVSDLERPRFMHATMHPDRAATMREWAQEAAACAS